MPPSSSLVVEELRELLAVFAGQAGPVDVHRQLDDRVRQDRRRPLDRVDLRHQRRVDQLGLAKQLLVVPVLVIVREQIADVVVLQREERVEHRQADPPVVAEAGEVHAGVGVDRQQAGWLDPELAGAVRAQLGGHVVAAAVDLRRVPPVAVRDWCRPAAASSPRAPGRGRSAARGCLARPSRRPRRRDVDALGRRAIVHEPVVHHELDPRGGQQVQDRRRLELVARHQLAADVPRVGDQQVRRVRERVLERDVAAEAAAGRAHLRDMQVVERAVGRPCLAERRIEIRRNGLLLERRLLGVVQVLLAQFVADLDEPQHREAGAAACTRGGS